MTMDRAGFFKRLIGGAAAVAVAPVMVIDKKKQEWNFDKEQYEPEPNDGLFDIKDGLMASCTYVYSGTGAVYMPHKIKKVQ